MFQVVASVKENLSLECCEVKIWGEQEIRHPTAQFTVDLLGLT
jgi:hypothetical protein